MFHFVLFDTTVTPLPEDAVQASRVNAAPEPTGERPAISTPNVVEPSPVPNVVPTSANSPAKVVRDTSPEAAIKPTGVFGDIEYFRSPTFHWPRRTTI